MASVSSLDKDLRKLRLERYTPAAARETRQWIEDILAEPLPTADLLDGLKDGVALCKLVNKLSPSPGIRYKLQQTPFVQMENIALFLAACKRPPLSLHQHDTFQTIDLYEDKDPAQVLQCLAAFSRAAHVAAPAVFPAVIGRRAIRPGFLSPQSTGRPVPGSLRATKTVDPTLRWSPTKSSNGLSSPSSPGGGVAVSSWSRREHEGVTAPAWNIAQYGYMGGASQGTLGISFGGRRQITNVAPDVPNTAEKERLRKLAVAEEEERRRHEEEERAYQEAEEAEQRRVEEEERARLEAEEEEKRWEVETARLRDEERRRVEEEQRRWDEQERLWKATEDKRRQEDADADACLARERQLQHQRTRSDARPVLQGQLLSQYHRQLQQEQTKQSGAGTAHDDGDADGQGAMDYSSRVRELERELELARHREADYELERAGRPRTAAGADTSSRNWSIKRTGTIDSDSTMAVGGQNGGSGRQESWSKGASEQLKTRALPPAPRPVPQPTPTPSSAISAVVTARPLPDPAAYGLKAGTTTGSGAGAGIEAGVEAGTAPRSLLEREMELERQRQREWEEAQRDTAARSTDPTGVAGVGGRWDVSQWSGFVGGDGQNRGSQGIGGSRRQIVGPRPLPSPR